MLKSFLIKHERHEPDSYRCTHSSMRCSLTIIWVRSCLKSMPHQCLCKLLSTECSEKLQMLGCQQ